MPAQPLQLPVSLLDRLQLHGQTNVSGEVIKTAGTKTDQALAVKAAGIATAGDRFVQADELRAVQGLPTYTFLPEEHQAIAFLKQVLDAQVVDGLSAPQPRYETSVTLRDPVKVNQLATGPLRTLLERLARTRPGSDDGSKEEVFRAQLQKLVKARREIDELGAAPDPARLQEILTRYEIGFLSLDDLGLAESALRQLFPLSARFTKRDPVSLPLAEGAGVTIKAVYVQQHSTVSADQGYDVMTPSAELFAKCKVTSKVTINNLEVACPAGSTVFLAAVDADGKVTRILQTVRGGQAIGAANLSYADPGVPGALVIGGSGASLPLNEDLLVVVARDEDGADAAKGPEVLKSVLLKNLPRAETSVVSSNPRVTVVNQ